jgi:hypothetical protein
VNSEPVATAASTGPALHPMMMATAVDPPVGAPAPTTSAAPASSTPDDRATAFQPTEGGGEVRSGETLLVEAYVVLWLILMGWLYLTWRRQSSLSAQLDDLEKTIDKAAAASSASKKTEKK